MRSKTKVEKAEVESEMCSICRVDIKNGDIIRKINHCEHFFHIECIDRWLEDQKKCPHCRYNLLESASNLESNDNNEEVTSEENVEANEV